MNTSMPPRTRSIVRSRLLLCTAMLSVAQALTLPALAGSAAPDALPTGGQVQSGIANITTAGTVMNVNQTTDKAIISWQQFNVGSGAYVHFQQPDAQSMTLNRVRGAGQSMINGTITAPGTVILVNPNGVLFGGGAKVDVGGLVASTMDIANEDFENGRLVFQRGASDGAIINEGSLKAHGGAVVLLASQITNLGLIRAELGSVILAAGETVVLTPDGGAPLKVDASLLRAEIEAGGVIQSTGGAVYLTAQAMNRVNAGVIKATGVIEATTLSSKGGKLVLDGSGPITLQGATLTASGAAGGGTVLVGNAQAASVTMDADSRIDASATEGGKGGTVIVNSRDTNVKGVLLARGGSLWGDGGFIETSGHELAFDGVRVDVGAIAGKGGNWLLDPFDLTVNAAYAAAIQTGLASGNVTLQTTNTAVNTTGVAAGGTTNASGNGDIFVNSGITWTSANSLTLDAYRGVTVNAAMSGTNLSVLTNNGGFGGQFAANAAVDLSAGLNINGTSYTMITSAAQLAGISASGAYALGRNLTLTSAWTPLGFGGTLEGLGHRISGLSINQPGNNNIGLFSSIGSMGSISNLGIVGAAVTGGSSSSVTNVSGIGVLAGRNSGTIFNSYATGSLSLTSNASQIGGLVGVQDAGTILSSHSDVAIAGGSNLSQVGGLVGRSPVNSLIISSYAKGNITLGSGATVIGGLVGFLNDTLSGSYATGTITAGDNSLKLGGLVGEQDSASLITQSYANGGVSAGISAQQVGGLVGAGRDISAAYALGSISVGIGATAVGGLVGASSANTTISAAYSTGSIVSGAGATGIGGFIGQHAGSIAASYYDTATSGLSVDVGTVNGGTGTATQIAANTTLSATYAGFDFANEWFLIDGRTRPFLRSEYSTIINNAHQLQLMSMDVTAAYLLGANIDLSRVTLQSDMWSTAGFTPVGFSTVSVNNSPAVFTGSLDGRGFTLSNLTINPVGYNNVGLFSSIGTTGSVANLTLANAALITGFPGTVTNSWGLIAGKSSGTVSNVTASGTIAASRVSTIGGLVGGLVGGTILNSSTGISVTLGTQVTAVGGLAGFTTGTSSISGSFATGNISVGNQNQRVGGLIGDAIGLSLVSSYATGNINGSGSGVQYVGGLVGLNNAGTISDTYATGNISLGSASQRVGGLVGYSTGLILNSYATGNISSGLTNNQYIGGLVGLLAQPTSGQASARVSGSYATGNITLGNSSTVGTAGIYVGGLVGLMQNGVATNSYATGNVSMGRTATYVGGLVGSMEAFNLTMSSVLGSYASGTISIGSVATDVGGLVGRANGALISGAYANGTITASSVGTITGNGIGGLVGNHTVSGSFPSTMLQVWSSVRIDTPSTVVAGGVVGRMLAGTVSNAYWDVGASGVTVSTGTSTGGTLSAAGFSGTDAYASATYGNLDFTNTWYLIEGQTRPFLRAENQSTITNAHQLQLISLNPNGNYVLGANITLAGLASTSGMWATGFVPVALPGSLDGRGKSISGLTVNQTASGGLGLFSTIGSTGSVSNLTLTGFNITGGGNYLGLLAGDNQGTISAVSASGIITALGSSINYVGGLVGSNTGTIAASSATATISAGSALSNAGLLVGQNLAAGVVRDSSAIGSILAGVSANNVGGLIGTNAGGVYGSNALAGILVGDGASSTGGLIGVNTGTVTASDASGTVQAGNSAVQMGGLVGYNNAGTIINSYATGTVKAGSAAMYVGGLVGVFSGAISNSYANATVQVGNRSTSIGGLVGYNAGTVVNAYALGSVAVGATSNYVGGLVGYSNATMVNVYATGSLVAGTGSTEVGGLVGVNAGLVSNGFWDQTTTGMTVGLGVNSGTSNNVAGFSTTDAFSTATYSNFDFTNTWYLLEGYTRPILRAEYSTSIGNAHQLQLVTMNLGGTYVLTRDINMGEVSSASGVWNTATGFVPIGVTTGTVSTAFTGTLDGQGHAINNLFTRINTGGGLFREIAADAVVQNVGLYNATVSTTAGNGNGAGILAGINGGIVRNAYATGTLAVGSDWQNIGGLIGFSNGIVTNAYSTAAVTAGANASKVGGLIGGNTGTLSAVYASGLVSAGAGASAVGGFVGQQDGSAVLAAYWDSSSSSQVAAVGSGTGVVTNVSGGAAFSSSTYSGFDLTNTWYMVNGYTRPFLRMEYSKTISNAHQLQLVNMDPTARYDVIADITMSELTQAGGLWSSTGWVPIGFNTTNSNNAPAFFLGSLNGWGRTISGLSITNSTSSNLGLISYIGTTGSITDLTLTNARISTSFATQNVGLLAGTNSGNVKGAFISGVVDLVSDNSSIGGMFGINTGTILNSGASVIVRVGNNSQSVGGLVGMNTAMISGGYATGSLIVGLTSGSVGGLVGSNSGTVALAYSTNGITVGPDSSNVGGLIGSNTGRVSSTYAANSINASAASNVAGLVGNGSGAGTVIDSFWDVTKSGVTVGVSNNSTSGVVAGLSASEWFSNGPIVQSVFNTADWVQGYPYPVLKALPHITLTGSGTGVYGQGAGSVSITGAFDQNGHTIINGLSTVGLTWAPPSANTSVGTAMLGASGATYSGGVYQFAYSGSVVITPASLTITASGATKSYGASISLTGFTTNGLVTGDSISSLSLVSGGSGTLANAGSYSIVASGASGTGLSNYSITYADGTLVVNPAALTITASGATKTYGNSINLTGFTSSGLVNGDSVSGVSLVSGGSGTLANAGSYSIVGSGASGTGLSNYSITYADGTLVVNPAALTITASGATKTYGNSINLTGFTSSGLVNGDSVSGVSLVSGGSGTLANVGSYSIVGTGASGTGLSNYSITYADGTLVVNPAALTITASGATKTYGNSINLTGFTSNGLVNSDSVSGVSLTSGGSGTLANVGSYSIVGSGASGTGLSNYSITYADGTLVVNPAALTITASGATKTYGNSINLTGFTSSGLVNGDSVSGISLVSGGSGTLANAGSYSIVGSGASGTGLSNYSVTYVDGTLVVNQASLTITASGATKTYGNSINLTGFTSSGLVNGDSVSGVSLVSGGSGTLANAGSYSVVGSGASGTGLSNYSITYADGTLVVNPAALTITASGATKTYGNSINLTGFTSSGLVNGDSVSGVSLTSGGSGTLANAGSYSIVGSGASGTGLSNYSITYADGTLVVNPAALTITASGATKTYGNSINLTGFTSNGLVNSDSISGVSLVSGGSGTLANAGSYSIVGSGASGTGLSNYSITYADGTLVVNPAALTITASGATKTYGNSINLTGFTSSGLINGDSISGVSLVSGGSGTLANAGSYSIVGSGASGTGLSNYSITYADGTLVVNPAALTITASGATKTYGNSINLTGFTSNGLVNSDSISGVSLVSGGSGTLANAGSYSIVGSGASGTGLSNYSITYADGTLVVNPAALVITASGATKTYGNSINLTGFTSNGLVNGDSISGVSITSGGSGTLANAGSYSIVASGAAGTGLSNYSITYADGTLVVNPAALTITASGATKTYGNSINLTGFTSSGLINGDSISGVSLTSGGSGTIATVGSYSIVGTGASGTGLSNYSITYADGTLVVNPAALVITASGATKTYGNSINLTGFTSSGLVNGDSVSGLTLVSGGSGTLANAGSYSIVASGASGTGLSNYSVTYADGTLVVNPAALVITASGATKTYGNSVNLTGFTSNGLVNSDSISGVSITSGGSGTLANAGSYSIVASGAAGTGLSNYSITYADGTLVVNPAALVITASGATKTYGNSINLTGFTSNGLVNSDSISGVSLVSGGSGTLANAGSYSIVGSGASGAGLSNYSITYADGTLVVNPAALVITASGATKTYGNSINLTGFTSNGLVNSDSVSGLTLVSGGSGTLANAGSYSIVASGASGAGLSNYSITYADGTLVVNPAALVITASGATKTYGNSINLTGFTSNGLVNGDSVSGLTLISGGSGTLANAGSYSIVASGAAGTGLSNYSITYADGTLVVNPAALTITASGATKTYGNSINLTGFTSNGLVNGDSVTSVSLTSSGADAIAGAGRYAIVGNGATGSGLSNYSITYAGGVLTVNPASLTITAGNATKTYGTNANLTGFTSSGLVNSDTVTGVVLTSSGAGTTASVGSYMILGGGATGTGLSNYAITYVDGTLAVNPASLTITAGNAAKTYGANANLTGFTSSGLVNDDSITGLSLTSSGAGATAGVGRYAIVGGGATGSGLSNYSITYTGGVLTVNPASLTITASNATKTYGNSINLTGFTSAGLVNNDTVTGVVLSSAGAGTTAGVGSYAILAGGATGTGLSNYAITYADGTLAVNPASLTITASNATKTYGNVINLTDFSSSGLVNGDSISGVSLTSAGSGAVAGVGNYSVLVSAAAGTGLSNYSITYLDGTLTVNRAVLTITANDVTRTYGVAGSGMAGFSTAGLVNGDQVTGVSLSNGIADPTRAVGRYDITVSDAAGTGLGNYTVNYVTGTLTVNRALLTITASDVSKVAGLDIVLSGFTTDGLVNGDSVQQVSLQSPGTPATAIAGSYVITADNATGTGLTNYTVQYQPGTLTVTVAAPTLTASTVQRQVVAAIVPVASLAAPTTMAITPASNAGVASTGTGTTTSTGGTAGDTSSSPASSSSTATSSSGGSTVETTGTTGGTTASGQNLPVAISGSEGGGVYDQLQMTSDPIKGAEQDDRT